MLSVARTVHPSVTSSKSFEKQIQIAHVQSLLQFSDISIDQGHLQNSLGACVQIAALADSLKEEEIQIEGASISEEARVLWAQGDTIASIKALERLDRSIDYTTEDIGVVSAEVLARIVGLLLHETGLG